MISVVLSKSEWTDWQASEFFAKGFEAALSELYPGQNIIKVFQPDGKTLIQTYVRKPRWKIDKA